MGRLCRKSGRRIRLRYIKYANATEYNGFETIFQVVDNLSIDEASIRLDSCQNFRHPHPLRLPKVRTENIIFSWENVN